MEESVEMSLEEVTKSDGGEKLSLQKCRKKQISSSSKKTGRSKNSKKTVEKIANKKKGRPKKKSEGVDQLDDRDDEINGLIVEKNESNKNKVEYPVNFDTSNAVVIVDGDEIANDENDDDDYCENVTCIAEVNERNDESLMMEEFYEEIVQELDVYENRITPKKEDEEMVNEFLSKDCCKRRCNTKFQSEELLLYRLELQGIDYNEHGVNQLDLVLLGLIHSLCRISDEIRHSRCIKKMKRRRIKMMFAFRGVSVCRAMFMFAHGIKIERLKRLLKRYKEDGIAPKPHGNYKRVPSNAISVEQIQEVVTFLRNYAKENAAVVPGRTSYLNQDIKLLPPNENKLQVFNKYKELCDEKNLSCISVVSFRRLWNRFCPDIVIQRPENVNGSHSQKNRSASKYTDDSEN